MGKREKAEEDRYFPEKTREELADLKRHREDEIEHQWKEAELLQKQTECPKMPKPLQDDDHSPSQNGLYNSPPL